MASLQYPKDLFHPGGAKTVSVWSAEDEQAVQKQFLAWKAAELEAANASREGRPVKPVK